MMKSVAQIALLVLAVVFGSAVVHLGVGYLTNGMVANRMKEYEQRWKEADLRVKAMEDQIAQLEKKRDQLHAEAEKEMAAAGTVAAAGKQRDDELHKRALTAGETAAINGTRVLEPEKLGGAGKPKLHWDGGPKDAPK